MLSKPSAATTPLIHLAALSAASPRAFQTALAPKPKPVSGVLSFSTTPRPKRPQNASASSNRSFHVKRPEMFATASSSSHASSSPERMLILYGSQTGTCESFAKTLASFSKSRGIAVSVQSMASFVERVTSSGGDVVSALGRESNVVLMTSTFYNGEFPDNALPLWKVFEQANTATASRVLANTKFAIFGLGNRSNKSNFNLAARRFENRIKELGAKEFVPAGYGDELSSSSHEAAFRPFVKSIWAALGHSSRSSTLPSAYRIQAAAPGSKASSATPVGYTQASVKANNVLSGKGFEREIRLISIDAKGGYPVAGHVLISTPNTSNTVSRALSAIQLPQGLTADTLVTITSIDNPAESFTCTVRQVLESHLELQGLATRSFLEALSVVATDAKEKEVLTETAEGMQDGNEYSKLTTGEVFSFVDALERYPSAKLSLEQLLSTVPRLQPRYYSIASSPLASPDAVDVIFGKDVWPTLSNPSRKFAGLASSYLANLKPGDKVAVKIQESPIKLPSPDTPLVAVGLGTGIGVPRGILQHYAALKKKGAKITPVELFYGFRHDDKDKVLAKELLEFEAQGLCKLSLSAMDQGSLVTEPIAKSESVANALLNAHGSFIYTGPGGVVPQAVELAVQESIGASRQLHPQAAAAELADIKSNTSKWIVEAYSREIDVENILKAYTSKVEAEKPLASVFENSKMLCFQCEQTFQGRGCTTVGVCGKTPQVAALQDLLVDVVKRLGWVNHQIRTVAASTSGLSPGLSDAINNRETDKYTMLALFSTLTNVNFDPESIRDFIVQVREHTATRTKLYHDICKAQNVTPQQCPTPNLSGSLTDPDALAKKGELVGILSKFRTVKNDVVVGLAEMLVYGLKGVCAYGDHAVLLGESDARVFNYVNEALAFLISPESADLNAVVTMLLRCGEANLVTMDTLHRANTKHGQQSPAQVTVGPTPGKAILISGHDMKYLEELLEQTKGTGINIYTHGEMLPAHGYPKLREYGNLVGHFGVAWQRQTVEFPHFPGPIVMTSNCLVPPKDDLKDRIFTAGAVAFPDCPKIEGFDFSRVIQKAQSMNGFREADTEFTYPLDPFGKPAKSYNVGFAYETVLSVAPQVISAIEKGDITRFYYIGGCDGFEGERNYYTELMENLPPTSVVLTSGCGKYRVLGDKLQYATIGDTGIPRLLDLGQCNDAYSAIKIAVALAEHFKCGVNDLPLNLVVSWFEQKAVAILLTLLHLNLKGVRIGPRLPAFVRPAALDFLVEKFDLKAIGDPLDDLKAMTGGK
ncbi:hybrid cluster protein [Gonapodya prolifera JEL478]|uniref:Hybrid cluster protein n=1 Tax=Gonapodya prolifera (strain JEL478) TaxID=1344416 RepID=A0A139A3R4_GONPJ|nr:hybrid cluster protein [Gonapodya prolifera JEL478]|eukprot:KXS11268.1 hybrid cluster protein [Gonapodya prolifera JEL478]